MTYTLVPAEVGEDMIRCALAEWFQYDDEGNFEYITVDNDGETLFTVSDPDEDKIATFSCTEFFNQHVALVYEGGLADKSVAGQYYSWASKVNNADKADYDSYTCDFVLQILLYGEVVYG